MKNVYQEIQIWKTEPTYLENRRIIELFRLEKTLKIMKSNH